MLGKLNTEEEMIINALASNSDTLVGKLFLRMYLEEVAEKQIRNERQVREVNTINQ